MQLTQPHRRSKKNNSSDATASTVADTTTTKESQKDRYEHKVRSNEINANHSQKPKSNTCGPCEQPKKKETRICNPHEKKTEKSANILWPHHHLNQKNQNRRAYKSGEKTRGHTQSKIPQIDSKNIS